MNRVNMLSWGLLFQMLLLVRSLLMFSTHRLLKHYIYFTSQQNTCAEFLILCTGIGTMSENKAMIVIVFGN